MNLQIYTFKLIVVKEERVLMKKTSLANPLQNDYGLFVSYFKRHNLFQVNVP